MNALDPRTVARVLGGKAYGNTVRAPGPGHSEWDDSLVVELGSDKPDGFTVYSHAGDDWQTCKDYVREKLGLEPFETPKRNANGKSSCGSGSRNKPRRPYPDLSSKPNGRTSSSRRDDGSKHFSDTRLIRDGYRHTDTYRYTDAAGILLYEVLRYEHPQKKKTFLQRRPDGNGGWYADAGARKVIYRWPGLDTVAHNVVFVTEGEKDADRLVSLGFIATTVAGGHWSLEAVQALADRQCLILEDNDEKGRQRALDAAERLYGTAESVRVVHLPELPPKGDVSDWLDADLNRAAQLVDIASATPLWAPAEVPIKATLFTWREPAMIPRRHWLYGRHIIREFISATVAPGGVGKTSLEIAEALSMVTGRSLLGDYIAEPLRVWIWNGEDPRDELERRIAATCLHYVIKPDDLGDRLFLDSGRDMRLPIARLDRNGIQVAEPVVSAIKDTVHANRIDVLIIDPFVKTHGVPENDNGAIDQVANEWGQIAAQTGCAVELVHHVRKGAAGPGGEHTVEDARGAIALIAAARSARVLNRMTKEEGEAAGVEDHRLFFRVDNGKANLAPPPEGTTWRRLISHDLPNGDNVGVVTPWSWPDPFGEFKAADLLRIQRKIAAGEWKESVLAKNWVGAAVAEVLGLDPCITAAACPLPMRVLAPLCAEHINDRSLRNLNDCI